MSELCIGTKGDGSLCDKRALRSGYCRTCDPANKRALVEARKKQAAKDAEKEVKREQREEIYAQQLAHMITECQSLEDLRKLELKVMQGLIDGSINDPRVGTPVVAILKHQEVLITKRTGNAEDLKDGDRERAVALAKQMSPEQMLGLIGDLAHGMKQLVKQAKTAEIEDSAIITVSAKEGQDA